MLEKCKCMKLSHARGIATPPTGGFARTSSATSGAMTPAEVEVACRPKHQAGRRAAGVPRRAMGKNISRSKQVTDWVARLEKLEQMLAAESGSSLLVQPAWIEKNVPDVCATNHWSEKDRPASVRFTTWSPLRARCRGRASARKQRLPVECRCFSAVS